ncbi:MAG: phosphatase PAP2 family protein [Bacteroidota bacterium]
MDNLKEKFFSNVFFKLSLVFIILGFFPLFIIDKGTAVQWVNSNIASPKLDFVFMNITHLGDGLVWLFITLALLFVKYAYAIIAVITAIFNLLFTSLFKQLLFKGLPRPTAHFEQGTFEHLIEGFTYHSSNTFPSGHTMTAFAAAFLISFFIKNTTIRVLMFILALLAGFSRIYLLLHFYIDVYFGAILGLICFAIAIFLYTKIFTNEKNKILSGSLADLFKR